MNFSQKLGLFILILISIAYVYFSFFDNLDLNFDFKRDNVKLNNSAPNYEIEEFTPIINSEIQEPVKEIKSKTKTVKIFLADSNGSLRSINRECNPDVQKSCFEYAIKELINAPTNWEKSKGFTSEIPTNTKIISIREGSKSIMIDLSSNFESGGGSDSIYKRVLQVIRTANANTRLPVYLYINGKQASVVGGDGIMLKQPLNERSLDE